MNGKMKELAFRATRRVLKEVDEITTQFNENIQFFTGTLSGKAVKFDAGLYDAIKKWAADTKTEVTGLVYANWDGENIVPTRFDADPALNYYSERTACIPDLIEVFKRIDAAPEPVAIIFHTHPTFYASQSMPDYVALAKIADVAKSPIETFDINVYTKYTRENMPKRFDISGKELLQGIASAQNVAVFQDTDMNSTRRLDVFSDGVRQHPLPFGLEWVLQKSVARDMVHDGQKRI